MTQQNKSFLKKLGEHLSLKEEVSYKLSFSPSEAEERLQDVMDKPPALDALGIGLSLKQKIVGTAADGKVYIARYTQGSTAQVKYGYFKGVLVEEEGSTYLKGSYEYFAKSIFIAITFGWIILELCFLGAFIFCFKDGSFSDCKSILGPAIFLPVMWAVAFLFIRGLAVGDWETINILIRKLLINPETILDKESLGRKLSPWWNLIGVVLVASFLFTEPFEHSSEHSLPQNKEIILSKERAAEFVHLYTKKRDVISECIKKAEPSIETKAISYREKRGCGLGGSGSFRYKVDKRVINIKLYVEWKRDPFDTDNDFEIVFKKLTSPEQMTCVTDFFATQGINLYLDYWKPPHPYRKFNMIMIGKGKDDGLFGNFYDVKNDRDLDDNQFCAMTVRHIALLLGAKHGGRPCYDRLNGESPFFQFEDDYEHFLENAKKDTNQLFLTDRELKNILSPTRSEVKVCELAP